MTEHIHKPGGHWELNDPLCAPLNKGGMDVPYSKCQDCGKLIQQVFERKNGKSITYFKEVNDG